MIKPRLPWGIRAPGELQWIRRLPTNTFERLNHAHCIDPPRHRGSVCRLPGMPDVRPGDFKRSHDPADTGAGSARRLQATAMGDERLYDCGHDGADGGRHDRRSLRAQACLSGRHRRLRPDITDLRRRRKRAPPAPCDGAFAPFPEFMRQHGKLADQHRTAAQALQKPGDDERGDGRDDAAADDGAEAEAGAEDDPRAGNGCFLSTCRLRRWRSPSL